MKFSLVRQAEGDGEGGSRREVGDWVCMCAGVGRGRGGGGGGGGCFPVYFPAFRQLAHVQR